MSEKQEKHAFLTALAIATGCVCPPALVAAAAVGLVAGGASGLYRLVSKPLARRTKGMFSTLAEMSEEARKEQKEERERQQLLFDAWLQQLTNAQRSLKADELQKVRLSLVLLQTAYPDLHQRLPGDVMNRLIEQYISDKDPDSDWSSRANLLEQRIVQMVAPESVPVEPPDQVVRRLFEQHEERMAALKSLPKMEGEPIEGMIEEEQAKFIDELTRAFGFQN